MNKHQTIVILGGGIFPDGKLTNLSLQRLDAGIQLFKKDRAHSITVLGGTASTYFKDAIHYNIPGAQKRAAYLIEKGIPSNCINQILGGKDTIGEAIACKDHLPSFNVSDFILVTSEIHMPRASWLFKKILGEKYTLDCFGVSCGGILLEAEEKEYLATTQSYFRQHPDCLKDTRNWHKNNEELYMSFKLIHDKFHPPGHESEAYNARLNGVENSENK